MLRKIKERILNEKKYRDVADACRNVGVTRTVFETAMSKQNYADLSVKEEEVLLSLIAILNKRRDNISKAKV